MLFIHLKPKNRSGTLFVLITQKKQRNPEDKMAAKPDKLDHYLKTVSKKGIQVDRQQLKKDMCSQFADRYEFIREYVVNAYDAQATICTIFGRETDDTLYIIIRDNGHGMDKKGLLDYFTLYRSVKRGDLKSTIGRHGIGKLSIASIPEQNSFCVLTSTGEQAWRATTGALLSEKPIQIERIEPVPERGTEFCIGFEKKHALSITMHKIYQTLVNSVRYLPLDIQVCIPQDPKNGTATQWKTIRRDWDPYDEPFGQRFSTRINGASYDIVMSLGSGKHELYQNRVLITDRYNLLSYKSKETWLIPHLHIRVDSPDFELPFGRHCLSNEEILPALCRRLRSTYLQRFFEQLAEYYHRADTRAGIKEIEELAVALCFFDNSSTKPWGQLPLFRLEDRTRLSMQELRYQASRYGKLYIASDDNSGVDYSIFDAPVLSIDQPGRGFGVLKNEFENEMIELSNELTIIEAPPSSVPELNQMEKKFQNALGFHPETLQQQGDHAEEHKNMPAEMRDRLQGTVKEIKSASNDLRDLSWRISYLVQADGKTAAKNVRFITRNQTVILNLYHHGIQALVNLSGKNPQLAAHWAIAICITENDKILPHLSAESKEDLLQIDAMARLKNNHKPSSTTAPPKTEKKREYWNFFRNANAS